MNLIKKNDFKKNVKNSLLGVKTLLASAFMAMPAYALDFESVTVNEGIDPTQTLGKALGMVIFVLQSIGGFAIVFGLVQLIQSIGDNNGDQRQKGVIATVVGILLFSLKYVLIALGIVS